MPKRSKPHSSKTDAHRRPDFLTWPRDGVCAALIFLLAFAVYANSLGNRFTYDDLILIRDNPRLTSPWNLRQFFGTSYWGDALEVSNLYRPLTILSFATDRALFGRGPGGVHAMNVLANALLGTLLYVFLLLLFSRRDLALAAALLFSLHPVHTEVVANGVGRSELYAGIAMAFTLLLHLLYLRPIRPQYSIIARREQTIRQVPRWIFLTGAAAFYFVSLLFKESAVVVPALLLLMEWIVLQGGRILPVIEGWRRFLPYGASLALYLMLRFSVIGLSVPAIPEVFALVTPFQRMLYASEIILLSVGQLVLPLRLCADYSDYRNLIRPSPAEPLVLASLLAWAGLIFLCRRLMRGRHFAPVFAVVWFFVSLLPTSNLLLPIGTVRAERLLFMPSLGFCLALACGITRIARGRKETALIILSIILVCYGWRTVTRNTVWRSEEALWSVTTRDNPGSPIAWGFMGKVLEEKGDLTGASEAYRRSFELRERAGFIAVESHRKYAELISKLGDKDTAARHYRIVLKKAPDDFVSLLNLGEILLRDPATLEESIDLTRKAIAREPARYEGYVNLAQGLRHRGRYLEALERIDQAIRLRPDLAWLREVRSKILSLSSGS